VQLVSQPRGNWVVFFKSTQSYEELFFNISIYFRFVKVNH
jgi:hypothetical protein